MNVTKEYIFLLWTCETPPPLDFSLEAMRYNGELHKCTNVMIVYEVSKIQLISMVLKEHQS